MKKHLAVPCFFLVSVLLPGLVMAGRLSSSLDALLDAVPGDQPVSVIVRFNQPPVPERKVRAIERQVPGNWIRDLQDKNQEKRAAIGLSGKNRLIQRERPLWIANSTAITAVPSVIRQLASNSVVREIVEDRVVTMARTLAVIPQAGEWNLDMIRVKDLWNCGVTGRGVVVASMDSGVDVRHPELAPKYRGGTNSWFDPNAEHQTPYDADGHGTQAMGLILAGNTGDTCIGAAPDAKWIAVKVFDDLGHSTLSGIHEGYQWLMDPDGDPDTDDAPDVVNNSWGLFAEAGTCAMEYAPDLEAMEAAGIINVFAAGNTGPNPGGSVSPANNRYALAVGSLDETGSISNFSGRGPGACDLGVYPHLAVPGQSLYTTDLSSGGLIAATASVSGTSFSSAKVAGVACLLKSAFPNLTPAELRQTLMDTALDLGPAGPDNDYGNGMVDALAAYKSIAGGCSPKREDDDGGSDGCFITSIFSR